MFTVYVSTDLIISFYILIHDYNTETNFHGNPRCIMSPPKIGVAMHCCHWQGQQLGSPEVVVLSTLCGYSAVVNNVNNDQYHGVYSPNSFDELFVYLCIALCTCTSGPSMYVLLCVSCSNSIPYIHVRYSIIISNFCLMTCFDHSPYYVNGSIAQIKINTLGTEWLVY